MKDVGVFVFILAVIGLILGAIGVAQSRAQNIVAWGVVAVSLGLALASWPG